jgi:hypothetical protein
MLKMRIIFYTSIVISLISGCHHGTITITGICDKDTVGYKIIGETFSLTGTDWNFMYRDFDNLILYTYK